MTDVVVVPLNAEPSPPDSRGGAAVSTFDEEVIVDRGLTNQGQVINNHQDLENQSGEGGNGQEQGHPTVGEGNNSQELEHLLAEEGRNKEEGHVDLWLRRNCCLWSKREVIVTDGKMIYNTKKCGCCWRDKVTLPLRNFTTKIDDCDERAKYSFQVETPSSTTTWRVIPHDSSSSTRCCRVCPLRHSVSWIKHSLGCCFSDNRSGEDEQRWVEDIRVARLGPTPGTEHVNKSMLANAEKYSECIQSLISQEYNLRNNRMTLFGIFQGFLWLSFAFLFSSAESCRNGFWIMQVILPIMGLFICLWTILLVSDANLAVEVLVKRWEIYKFNSGDPRTKYYERPVLGLDGQERSRARRWCFPFFIALGWAGCLVATSFLEDCRWTVYSSSNTTSTSSPSSS